MTGFRRNRCLLLLLVALARPAAAAAPAVYAVKPDWWDT